MTQVNLLIYFWGDVLLTVAYIPNRVPSKSIISTPYKLWSRKRLKLSHLRS